MVPAVWAGGQIANKKKSNLSNVPLKLLKQYFESAPSHKFTRFIFRCYFMFLLVLFLFYINQLIKMEQERQSINEIINFYIAVSGE